MGGRKSGLPKVVGVNKYQLPPPIVLNVVDSPLMGYSSLGGLMDTLLTIENAKHSLSAGMQKLFSEKGGPDESLVELANKLVRLRSSAALSILLATHTIPRNALESGELQKFFVRIVAAAGIMYSLGREDQAKDLLRLARIELETLKVARRIFAGRDEWAKLASYVGGDIPILIREYESGSSSLKPIIKEIAEVVAEEIEFAVSCLSKMPNSKAVDRIMKELQTELDVLERTVITSLKS